MPPVGDAYYDAFFNDTIIIGDSITGGLRNYVIRERAARPTLLGDAEFYASAKYGLQHAASLSKKRMPYNGNGVTLPYLLKRTEAKKVFVMLGLNNWAGAQIEKCIELYRQMIVNLRAVNPDVLIYLESCTPVVKTGEREKVNNENLDAFNAALRKLCRETGVFYVDIATPLKGEDNAMRPEYSKDGYVHMSPEGAAVWLDALYQFAYDATLAGWYTPEDGDAVMAPPLPELEPMESYIPTRRTGETTATEETVTEETPEEAAPAEAEPEEAPASQPAETGFATEQ